MSSLRRQEQISVSVSLTWSAPRAWRARKEEGAADKSVFIPFVVEPWSNSPLWRRRGVVTVAALPVIKDAWLYPSRQQPRLESQSGRAQSYPKQKNVFFPPLFVLVVVFLFLLQNCVNNLTISPLRCTASSPLAKPGKLLPLVSLSQEKKSGTSIQMITELGKPSLCHPLRPRLCARPRRSAPHHFCLDLSGCSQGPRCSHGFTLNTFCFLILCSGWNWLSCFGPFQWFFFLFFVGGDIFFPPLQLHLQSITGFWSCSICPCGCFHSNNPPYTQTHTHTHSLSPQLSSGPGPFASFSRIADWRLCSTARQKPGKKPNIKHRSKHLLSNLCTLHFFSPVFSFFSSPTIILWYQRRSKSMCDAPFCM